MQRSIALAQSQGHCCSQLARPAVETKYIRVCSLDSAMMKKKQTHAVVAGVSVMGVLLECHLPRNSKFYDAKSMCHDGATLTDTAKRALVHCIEKKERVGPQDRRWVNSVIINN